jgi:hypothetical protein
MKKTLFLILTLAGSLLLSGFAVAQSSAKIEANQTPRNPVRLSSWLEQFNRITVGIF